MTGHSPGEQACLPWSQRVGLASGTLSALHLCASNSHDSSGVPYPRRKLLSNGPPAANMSYDIPFSYIHVLSSCFFFLTLPLPHSHISLILSKAPLAGFLCSLSIICNPRGVRAPRESVARKHNKEQHKRKNERRRTRGKDKKTLEFSLQPSTNHVRHTHGEMGELTYRIIKKKNMAEHTGRVPQHLPACFRPCLFPPTFLGPP